MWHRIHFFDLKCEHQKSVQQELHKQIHRCQKYLHKAFCLTSNQLWHPNTPSRATHSCSAEREGGDPEVSTGIHNVSFLSLFVLSFAPQGLCFTWARQQRHATLNLGSLPRRLLALSPPESANDRCYLHHSNLLQSGETYLPNPRWLFRIANLAGQISAPSRGLDSLSSLHLSHAEAKHFCFFFHKPSDPTAVDCISAIP